MNERDEKQTVEIPTFGPHQVTDYSGPGIPILSTESELFRGIELKPIDAEPIESPKTEIRVTPIQETEKRYKIDLQNEAFKQVETPKIQLTPNQEAEKNVVRELQLDRLSIEQDNQNHTIPVPQPEYRPNAQPNIDLSPLEALSSVDRPESQETKQIAQLPEIQQFSGREISGEVLRRPESKTIPENISVEFPETFNNKTETKEIKQIGDFTENTKTDNNLRLLEITNDSFFRQEVDQADKGQRLIEEMPQPPAAERPVPPQLIEQETDKPLVEEHKEVIVKLHPSTAFYLDGDILRVAQ